MVDQTLETLEVRGESGNMPTHIDVDISELAVGDKLHVSDLPTSPNFEILSHGESAVVSILAVQHAEEPKPAEAAAASPAA